MLMVLANSQKYEIKRVSTYQSVTGTGLKGLNQPQMKTILLGRWYINILFTEMQYLTVIFIEDGTQKKK